MSEQQTKEAAKLFDKYAEAKTWWEGLGTGTQWSYANKHFNIHASRISIGQITQIWETENKTEEKPDHLLWWDKQDADKRQALCNYNFAGVHPSTLLDKSILFLWEKETQQPEPVNISKEKPVYVNKKIISNIEDENKLLKETLQKIVNYPLEKEIQGMPINSVLINILSFAQIALHQTTKQQG